GLVFEEGQLQVLEDERGQLVNVHLRLVVVRAQVLAGGPRAAPLTGLPLARDNVADAGLAVALPDVLALPVVEAELVLVERADGDFDAALAVRKNDRLVRDNRAEVLADGVLHALLVPLLVNDALALQRPVVALDRPRNLRVVRHPDFSSPRSPPLRRSLMILSTVAMKAFSLSSASFWVSARRICESTSASILRSRLLMSPSTPSNRRSVAVAKRSTI